jgi:hypothetical protein
VLQHEDLNKIFTSYIEYISEMGVEAEAVYHASVGPFVDLLDEVSAVQLVPCVCPAS